MRLHPHLLLRWVLISWLGASALPGCSCSSDLHADGPTPYLRCAMMDPPSARDITVGEQRLEVIERNVIIHSTGTPRIVVARGPAGAGEPLLPGLDAIEAAQPSVVILLGDLGDGDGNERASIEALRAALAQLTVPVLLLPGGRDAGAALREVLDDGSGSEHVVDLSGVRSVRIGDLELVPLPGAPGGRYALDEERCGLAADDVEAIASGAGSASGVRLLLSTAAPATGDVRTAGIAGNEAGEPLVRDALSQLGATGGIYATPESAIGQPFDGTTAVAIPTGASRTLHLVVPRLLGPATERVDGSRRASGVMVLEVRPDGVAVLEAPR